MHAFDVAKAAAAGTLPEVVVLAGAERFFTDRVVAALRKKVAEGGVEGFNEEIFHGKGTSAARVMDAARTLPMMAERRFVLVRGIDEMAPAELDRLTDYLDKPVPSTCLVLTADKLDGRSRFAKLAKKQRILAAADPLKPGEVRGFIQSEAKRRGMTISPDAMPALADALGTDLPAIDDALERLSLYAGDGKAIALEAVEACVVKVRVESIWALVDAVSMHNRPTALKAAASLLADREPPLKILAMLSRQLRMVGRMRAALAAGMPPAEAARQAGAPPFKARDLASAARRFGDRELQRAFEILSRTDLALKGSRCPPDIVLETAVLDLTVL